MVDLDGKVDVLKLVTTAFGSGQFRVCGTGRTITSAPAETATLVFELWERDAEKDPLARAKRDVQLFFDKEVPSLVGDKSLVAKSAGG